MILILIKSWKSESDNFDAGTTINWGVLARCSGCTEVWSDVQELAGVEVLIVECTCPPQPSGQDNLCICSGRFSWWWNLQCASNFTVNTHLPNGSLSSCSNSVASWSLVAGNVSSENQLEATSGVCPGTGKACSGALHNISISTRQVDVELRLAGASDCATSRRVIWTLPIEASLHCSNVDQFLGSTLDQLAWREK